MPKRQYSNKGKIIRGGIFLSVFGAVSWLSYSHMSFSTTSSQSIASWNNIGGCGGGGGGAAAGAGKWIGRGVSGGLLDVEALTNVTIGGDYRYDATSLSLTQHYLSIPNITTNIAMSWKSNQFEVEGFKTAEDPQGRIARFTGGFSDLGLSVNRLSGNENEHSMGLSFGLPTGQHDIKRLNQKKQGEADDIRWMNPFVQPGTGLYNLGLSYEYTKDKDWGLLIWGASYSAAFAWDNNSCKDIPGDINEKVLNCQNESPSALTWRLWELQHQKWGEQKNITWENSFGAPGTGATGQDNFSVYGHVGRKEESSTQSLGLTLSIPTAPQYYWEAGDVSDNSRVATRIRSKTSTLKLSGGIEITNPHFPLFIAVGVPWVIEDIVKRGRLTDPQNYVGTVGIKGTFF